MAGQLTLDQLVIILGSRPTAGHIPLEDGILVRIQAPQPKNYLEKKNSGYFDFKITA